MAVETPTPPAEPAIATPELPEPSPSHEESISDHAKALGLTPKKSRSVSEEAAPVAPAPKEDGEEGERDAQGRFKIRHRAESQKAKPEDVPRINELTAKLRAAEAERDALKKVPPSVPAVQAVAPTPPLRKPEAEDMDAQGQPLYKTLSAYMDARDMYNRQFWAAEEQAKREVERVAKDWEDRKNAGRERYPDFEQVALKTPDAELPRLLRENEVVKKFIYEAPDGTDILYGLIKDPKEAERLEALTGPNDAFTLFRELTLLGQRLTARFETQKANKSLARVQEPAPRPPNPVRTGPMKGAEELPGDDASLAEHAKVWGPRRRH